ncbi:MAG: substrate-binding domain-containing protein, partial [Hyphomicrobiaceae bacterium]
ASGGDWDFEQIGFNNGLQLIADRALPSSTVLCSNDRIAIGLLAAAYQRGLRVGRGDGCALRVAGHDDHPWSKFTCPSLTTVAQDYESIATKSVQVLFELINDETRAHERHEYLFEGKLVMRSSA